VWQWLRHKARLDDGQVITRERFDQLLREEMDKLRR
jgi:malate synthase